MALYDRMTITKTITNLPNTIDAYDTVVSAVTNEIIAAMSGFFAGFLERGPTTIVDIDESSDDPKRYYVTKFKILNGEENQTVFKVSVQSIRDNIYHYGLMGYNSVIEVTYGFDLEDNQTPTSFITSQKILLGRSDGRFVFTPTNTNSDHCTLNCELMVINTDNILAMPLVCSPVGVTTVTTNTPVFAYVNNKEKMVFINIVDDPRSTSYVFDPVTGANIGHLSYDVVYSMKLSNSILLDNAFIISNNSNVILYTLDDIVCITSDALLTKTRANKEESIIKSEGHTYTKIYMGYWLRE